MLLPRGVCWDFGTDKRVKFGVGRLLEPAAFLDGPAGGTQGHGCDGVRCRTMVEKIPQLDLIGNLDEIEELGRLAGMRQKIASISRDGLTGGPVGAGPEKVGGGDDFEAAFLRDATGERRLVEAPGDNPRVGELARQP